MKLSLFLAVLLIGAGLLFSSCGSGGAPELEDASTGTVRSERVEREASIMQQQQPEQAAAQVGDGEQQEDGPAQPAADPPARGNGDARSGDSAEQADQVGDGEQQAAVSAGVIDFGHRQGLPFARNVVGDPNAPVVIVEYSDFQ